MIWPFKKKEKSEEEIKKQKIIDRIHHLWDIVSVSKAKEQCNDKIGIYGKAYLGLPILNNGVKYYPVYEPSVYSYNHQPIEFFRSVEEFEKFIDEQKSQRKEYLKKRVAIFKKLCEKDKISFEEAKKHVWIETSYGLKRID